MKDKQDSLNGLHRGYQRTLEVSFICALFFLCFLFFSFQKNVNSYELPDMDLEDVPIEIIPPTKQPPERKPKPPTPTIPVADDDIQEMEPNQIENIFSHKFDKDLVPPPDNNDIEQIWNTWELSTPPKLKYKAVPYYPDLARKAGIKGRVIVTVIISKTGRVIDATITSGVPMLNEAALEAARRCTFFPAKQRDKFVKVKMAIPFDFRLN